MKDREQRQGRNLVQSTTDFLQDIEGQLQREADFFHNRRLKKGVYKGFPDEMLAEMDRQVAGGIGNVRKLVEKLSGDKP